MHVDTVFALRTHVVDVEFTDFCFPRWLEVVAERTAFTLEHTDTRTFKCGFLGTNSEQLNLKYCTPLENHGNKAKYSFDG